MYTTRFENRIERLAKPKMDDLNCKGTILFVDDEEMVLNVGSMMIERLGYRILKAASGMEAAEVFNDNKDNICLVLLDINLPDEIGSDTCKKIKTIDPYVKVIHTSGLGMNEANQTLDCGCKGFLAKPFKINELSNVIEKHLEITDEQKIFASHY